MHSKNQGKAAEHGKQSCMHTSILHEVCGAGLKFFPHLQPPIQKKFKDDKAQFQQVPRLLSFQSPRNRCL